jgi:hypothetical protein
MWRNHQHYSDERLILILDGERSSTRQAAVAAHVACCAGCRARLDEIRAALGDGPAPIQTELGSVNAAPDYRRIRLEYALRQVGLDESVSRLWPRAYLALAASVALLFVAVLASKAPFSLSTAPKPGALPVAHFTPGAVSPLTAVELCRGARPSPVVSEAAKRQILRNYKMEQTPGTAYELDALIPLELGGNTDAENLWPQRYRSPVWNALVKDELERLLPALVCRHHVALERAQRDIATDWIAAYKRYFRTDVPLHAHLQPVSPSDDDELVYAEALPVEVGRLRLIRARFESRRQARLR